MIELYTFLAPTTANRAEAAAVAVKIVVAAILFFSVFVRRFREVEDKQLLGATTMEGMNVEWNENFGIQRKKEKEKKKKKATPPPLSIFGVVFCSSEFVAMTHTM